MNRVPKRFDLMATIVWFIGQIVITFVHAAIGGQLFCERQARRIFTLLLVSAATARRVRAAPPHSNEDPGDRHLSTLPFNHMTKARR
jgi:hypothetical protein